MKQEFAEFIGKLRVWKTFLVQQVKLHSKEWSEQVIQTQNNWYQIAHDQIAGHAPAITKRYDESPQWFKGGMFYLPWFCVFIIVLNYFNVFDRRPTVKSVQDPNVVVVNDDLRKMITDGTAQVSPFVEELRASGRIDFNELFLSRIGANVTGRVSEILAVPGQIV
jgi:cobalt-zinc-cadmium efflux system membrane fusion protein